jgi:hypothetical protein
MKFCQNAVLGSEQHSSTDNTIIMALCSLDAILDEHKFHQAFPFLNLDGFIPKGSLTVFCPIQLSLGWRIKLLEFKE